MADKAKVEKKPVAGKGIPGAVKSEPEAGKGSANVSGSEFLIIKVRGSVLGAVDLDPRDLQH